MAEGVPHSISEAVRFYKKAANHGHPTAQQVLGSIYMSGDGVYVDHTQAIRWWRRAAAQGDSTAQSLLEDSMSAFTKPKGRSRSMDPM
jgi:TPR repeat protein